MPTTKEKSKFRLSAIVPAHNEEQGLAEFCEALHACLVAHTNDIEIIVVNDGSKDKTDAIAIELSNRLPIKYLELSRNFGKEKAISAGLANVSGDATIIIDADFQHPLETITEFIKAWQEGYDNVYAVRKDRKDQRFFNRLYANCFYTLNRKIMDINLPRNAGDFRLLDRKVIDALNQLPETNRFMKGLYAWVGFKGKAVPYEVQSRRQGKSSWSFFNLLGLAMTGITSFSSWPLRVWSIIGFIISTLAFIYGAYVVLDTLLFGATLPGWTTLTAGIMFLGGLQLLSIGVIGEYIARIFNEVKGRPNYLIAKRIGFEEKKVKSSRNTS